MPKPLSNDFRVRVVHTYEIGNDGYDKIAKRFGLHLNTVYRWVQLSRKNGDVSPKTIGGSLPKIKNEELGELIELVAQKPDRTLVELADLWNKEHGTDVHRSSVDRALGRAQVTRKKTFRASKRSRAHVLEKERVFLEKMSQVLPEKLHCYDEASSHLGMTRSHARCHRGQRAICQRTAAHAENITMVGLLGSKGIKALYPYTDFFLGQCARFLMSNAT